MNISVINVKVDPKLKKAVQKAAREEGLSVSSVVNLSLRKFIKKRTSMFGDDIRLEPTPYLKRILKQSEKDIKAGRVSPTFRSAEESFAWLDDPKARYQNGDPVR